MELAVAGIEMAVNVGISYLFPAQGPRLKDLQVSASTYGIAIPQIFGTARAAGNMIWAGPIQEHKTEQFGGKGGFYNNYTYSCSFAFAFAEGPIQSIDRIWANGQLIFDSTGTTPAVQNGKYQFTVYLGTEEQMPDATIESYVGAHNTPAYRGLAYVVFENFNISNFGNMIPQFAAQVTANGNSSAPYLLMTNPAGLSTLNWWATSGGGTGVGIDYQRGLLWMNASGPGNNVYGLAQYSCATGKELNQYVISDMMQLVCVGKDGSLFVALNWLPNRTILAKLDPITLTEIAHAGDPPGQAYSDIANGTTTWYLSANQSCVSNDGGTLLYFDYAFEGGSVAGHSTASCERIWRSHIGGTILCGCPYLQSDFAILVQIDSTHLAVVQASTGATLCEINAPGISGVCAVWDVGNPGVVFGFTTTGAAQSAGAGGTKAGQNAINGPGAYVAKFSSDSQTIQWTTKVPGLASVQGISSITQSEFVWAWNDTGYMLNTVDGSFVDRAANQYLRQEVWEINQAAFQPDFDPNRGWPLDIPNGGHAGNVQVYDSLRQSLLCLPNHGSFDGIFVFAGQANGASTTLQTIVEVLLREGGLTSNDFDMSGLSSVSLAGYGFASNTDIKSVIAELRQIFLFDIVETDFVLRGRLRGSSTPDQVINALCLGSSSPEANDYWKQTRVQEADLPARITLSYMNVDQDFQVSTASYKRPADPIPTMYSQQQVAIQANIAMDPAAAKNQVRSMMFTQWSERTMHSTRFPWAYLYLDPSDLIQVDMADGRQYFERINEAELGADLTSAAQTYGQNAGAYAKLPNLAADGGAAPPATITMLVAARAFVMNTPLLRDSDDLGGAASRYYVAAGCDGGPEGVFQGAALYRSTNNSDYALLDTLPNGAAWGVVRGTVPDAALGIGAIDWKTQITIVPAIAPSKFVLSSITEDELWAGSNPIIIGNEVMQFMDAVQNADGSWTISKLLRGQRGTGYACATHAAAEIVVLLDPNTIDLENESLDAVGQRRWFKGVGDGMSINNTSPVAVAYYPRDLMPYAPCQIQRTINANGDIVLTWARRSRFAATLQDSTGDVLLGEASESYQLYLLSAPFAGDPSTNAIPEQFVRAANVINPTPGVGLATWTYTAAEQTADGFVKNLDSLNVVVYQMSAAVGPGFPGYRSIEPWRKT